MAKLTAAERNALPRSAFALPEYRRYPIQDREHAELALRMMDNESQEDQTRIKAAVKRAFPDLGPSHVITHGRNLSGKK